MGRSWGQKLRPRTRGVRSDASRTNLRSRYISTRPCQKIDPAPGRRVRRGALARGAFAINQPLSGVGLDAICFAR